MSPDSPLLLPWCITATAPQVHGAWYRSHTMLKKQRIISLLSICTVVNTQLFETFQNQKVRWQSCLKITLLSCSLELITSVHKVFHQHAVFGFAFCLIERTVNIQEIKCQDSIELKQEILSGICRPSRKRCEFSKHLLLTQLSCHKLCNRPQPRSCLRQLGHGTQWH